MSESSTGRITGIHTIGVPVSDQDTALRFYVGTLGFEERMDAPLPQGARWIEVAPPGSAVSVALVAAGEERPSGGESGITRREPAHAANRHDPITSLVSSRSWS